MVSIQNLQANHVNKLLVCINHDKLIKEESVAKNSSKVSGIKIKLCIFNYKGIEFLFSKTIF